MTKIYIEYKDIGYNEEWMKLIYNREIKDWIYSQCQWLDQDSFDFEGRGTSSMSLNLLMEQM